jgi:hypothetical protein
MAITAEEDVITIYFPVVSQSTANQPPYPSVGPNLQVSPNVVELYILPDDETATIKSPAVDIAMLDHGNCGDCDFDHDSPASKEQ